MAFVIRTGLVFTDISGNDEMNLDTVNGVQVGDGLLVGLVIENSTPAISSVAISGTESNATAIGSPYDITVAGRGQRFQFFWHAGMANAGNKVVTITLGAAANFNAFAAFFTTGIDSVVDGAGATGTSVSAVDGITTTVAGAALFQIANLAGGEGSVGAGLVTGIDFANLFNWHYAAYNLDAGSAGAKTPTITQSSGAWGALSVAVQPVDAGGDSVMPLMMVHHE